MNATDIFAERAVSPALELGAYEELWTLENQSFKKLAEMFGGINARPSQFVDHEIAEGRADEVFSILKSKRAEDAGFLIQGSLDYPQSLLDAVYPVQFLYYRGNLNLVHAPLKVALVGSREASEDGIKRTKKLAKCLVEDGVIVVSGLAKGIDTAAHTAAIACGGKTIAVIGTPISEAYPRENSALQEMIAKDHLLISQVPVLRYKSKGPQWNRFFFPERNATMSAISNATVIVEAGETSGSLIQARAALAQKRKLFILDNCFKSGLKWPNTFLERGAIRVSSYQDIKNHLKLYAVQS